MRAGWLVSIGAASIVACAREPDRSDRGSRPLLEGNLRAPRTILLVVLDGARADHLGMYGHPHETMPELARFAERAVVFEDALTASSGTNAALASLFTGLWPDRHGLGSLHELGQQHLRASADTLAERLAAAGWRTVGVTALPQLGAELSGLAQGFERYHEAPRFGEDELLAQDVYYRALRELEPHLAGEEPLFACVHFADARSSEQPDLALAAPFLEAHLAPFRAERADVAQVLAGAAGDPARALDDLQRLLARARGSLVYDAWQAALHDARLAGIDRHLALLIDALDSSGRLDEAMVIVAGTRGELYEGRRDPTGAAFPDALVRIPLVVALPSVAHAHVSTSIPSVDLAPSVLEALALPATGLDGRSFLGLLRDAEPVLRPVVVWSAPLERWAVFAGGHVREHALTGPDAYFARGRGTRLAPGALDREIESGFDSTVATIRERTPPERWIVEYAGEASGELYVHWRFEDGFVRGVRLASQADDTAPASGGPTRVDGSRTLAQADTLEIEGSRRSLSMRLVLRGPAEGFGEQDVHVGTHPLLECFLPRVPAPVEEPWPLDEQDQPLEPQVDFVHRGDSWWQLGVSGTSGAPVRILLARYPPTRPDEPIVASPAIGDVRPAPGRLDALWIEGEAPLEVHLEKRPSDDLALAVAIDGELVPVERIRWRGRRFSPPGELALYLPDWMAGASEALDEPVADGTALAPGGVRIRRATSSIAPEEHVPLGKEDLDFVRWLGGDE